MSKTFQKRTTKPTSSDLYYVRFPKGYSQCVQGYPKDKECDALSNCVGYACGRFNEIIGSMKYPKFYTNAENFIEVAIKYGLEITNYPTLGGIMVFQKGATLSGSDGAGHVFIVEGILDTDEYGRPTKIFTSESGYGSRAFWNSTRSISNNNWQMGAGYKFRGCIKNPNVSIVEPIDEPEDVLTCEELLQLTRETIQGKYGNGKERVDKLGKNYNRVMEQVNKNMRDGHTSWDSIKLY